MIYKISKPDRRLVGEITLDGSKSISNRILIINALCNDDFKIHKISTSKDTQTLIRLLAQKDNNVYNTGAAGTTFRFMTAYLAFQEGTQILTGSERMKQRPIGKLVNALLTLGCDVEYLEKENYPPLKINSRKSLTINELKIDADTSSQYITALLMMAPTLPQGLKLTLEGNIVSLPYIQMTLSLMQYFGIVHTWSSNTIVIENQPYVAKDIVVEADWSAASYYYALAVFADELDLKLHGLFENSLQGDSVAIEMGFHFGIDTTYIPATDGQGGSLHLKKSGQPMTEMFECDFLKCPDIAQTFAVICAGTGVQGLFTGLETLFIKETDRVAALKHELSKLGVSFIKLPAKFSQKSHKQYFMIEGKAQWDKIPLFSTYEDHRMAMSFAPLAMFNSIKIEDPSVVDKSYPHFWEDLKKLGFEIQ